MFFASGRSLKFEWNSTYILASQQCSWKWEGNKKISEEMESLIWKWKVGWKWILSPQAQISSQISSHFYLYSVFNNSHWHKAALQTSICRFIFRSQTRCEERETVIGNEKFILKLKLWDYMREKPDSKENPSSNGWHQIKWLWGYYTVNTIIQGVHKVNLFNN